MTVAIEPPTIVVETLTAEFRRMRNKLDGATKRLAFAQAQARVETELMAEHKRDLDMLADVLISSGGSLPPPDPTP